MSRLMTQIIFSIIIVIHLLEFHESLVFVTIDSNSCAFIPKLSKLPIECCIVPSLFTDEIKSNCRSSCETSSLPQCCIIKCLLEQSDLLTEEKFDMIKAKSLLEKVFKGKKSILNFLDRILNRCEQQDTLRFKHKNKSKNNQIDHDQNSKCSNPEYGIILSCIHRSLFRLCPEVKPDQDCSGVKTFMDRCRHRNFALRDFRLAPMKTTISTATTKDDLGKAMFNVLKKKF